MKKAARLEIVLNDEEVRRAYRNYLWREPDAAGKQAWLGKTVTREALEAAFTGSAEHREHIAPILKRIRADKSPKILLFGAYGNGNLGDDIQANALAELVMAAVPEAKLYATSCFKGAYPFESGQKLRRGAIYSHVLLSEFDMLVIGGGGLLAHPHEPLADALWAKDLAVRTIFFGVGADECFVDETAKALRKAAFVGCRDAYSLALVSKYTAQVAITLDPVLLSKQVGPPTEREIAAKKYSCCWIVRNPIENSINYIQDHMSLNDIIIGIEPSLDRTLKSVFPEINLLESLDDIWEIVGASNVVVSMRYHGLILAIKAGVPAFALEVGKAERLLSMLGIANDIDPDMAGVDVSTNTRSLHSQTDCWRSASISHLSSQFGNH